ncbi:hypothetical protein WI38_15385 [Burkholderia ubonensis]|uniref:Uncharacterized protein n=2 Tax=Burkholderia ubonensis TaxID=101571 RepID=A0A102M0I0_9BURK|nr:hypothetical protein WI35_00685 [Burkholderia ubonensis]KUZ89551.1 hypothetical protein WI38_15385 [Burkholderia ubonensis]KVA03325.1 hypothetical protein WI39_30625 [Burkholderia ubonensis]
MVLADEATNDVAIITQLLEGETSDRSGLNVLLDIDVSHACKIDGRDIGEISSVMNRLRDFKNGAFFGFLEENILEQYA